MQHGKCPACDSDIIIDDEAFENDLVSCPNCGAEAEIVSLRPLRLELSETDSDPLAEEEDDEQA